jgi:glycosyltransferase involved in cell wall biosynthesis
MPAIHQLVAGFSNGDAISNEARVLRRMFRSWGYDSSIYSEVKRILPELRRDAINVSDLTETLEHDDVAFLHLSIGSPVNEVFANASCRKVILYHNVTPAHYFEMINKQTAFDLAKGRQQLKALANVAEINLADSQFNADELTELGYASPRVLPLVLELEKLNDGVDRRIMRRFNDGRTNILFVGRVAPNKKIEDLIRAFLYFNRTVQAKSRLINVGSFAGTEPYYYYLLAQTQDLDDDHVHFAGSVPQSQLNAYYRCADIFLCMSEHEGFCIPLIEAMAHDIPVLAFAAGAVPETLDGSGVIFHEKDFPQVAEMLGHLTTDSGFRSAVIRSQRQRLGQYRERNLERELKEHLAPILSSKS